MPGPDPINRGDDPRGHDDGDVFSGDPEERAKWLDAQIASFFADYLAAELGYAGDELADACARAEKLLRTVTPEERRSRRCPGPANFARCSNMACRHSGGQGGAGRP
jgi:hypothetical protein